MIRTLRVPWPMVIMHNATQVSGRINHAVHFIHILFSLPYDPAHQLKSFKDHFQIIISRLTGTGKQRRLTCNVKHTIMKKIFLRTRMLCFFFNTAGDDNYTPGNIWHAVAKAKESFPV